MVKKGEDKKEQETVEGQNMFNQWVNSSNEFLKLWGDSNYRLYKPWMDFMSEKSSNMKDMSAAPAKYREFFDDWLTTYKKTYGKFYSLSSPKEALEAFVKCADESNKVYMSWVEALKENSRNTAEVLNDGINPEKYGECYQAWMKVYEKILDDLNDHPAIKYQRDVLENYTGMPNPYSESLAKTAKQMKEIYFRLFVPSDESIKNFAENLAKLSKTPASPEAYMEFYDMWLNNYKQAFSKIFDPQTMKPSKELLDSIKESIDVNISLFKSWTDALEKISSKMDDRSKLVNDPESFMEFYNLWIKMYEKTSEDVLEGMPLVSPLKEMMEPVKNACKVYSSASVKMSRMWMDSFSKSAAKV